MEGLTGNTSGGHLKDFRRERRRKEKKTNENVACDATPLKKF